MSCAPTLPRWRPRPPAARGHRPPSLVRALLRRNGVSAVARDHIIDVPLDSSSRIVVANGSRVWCSRYPGLGGLFRKDRGPSKELGRALCDEVRSRFDCQGFLTTDELPRYGIGRKSRRAIQEATGATAADAVVIYAYEEILARQIDAYVCARLRQMS